MKQAMQKWLQKFQMDFDTDTAHKLCDKLGLEDDKVDDCLGLCYQLDKGAINEAEFTVGLGILADKKPEEVMEILKGLTYVEQKAYDFLLPYLTSIKSNFTLEVEERGNGDPSVVGGVMDEDNKSVFIGVSPRFNIDAPGMKDALLATLAHELGHLGGVIDEGIAWENGLKFATMWGIKDRYIKDMREIMKPEEVMGILGDMKAEAVSEVPVTPEVTKRIVLSEKDMSNPRWGELATRDYAKSLGFTEKIVGDIGWRNPRNRKQEIGLVGSSKESQTITIYNTKIGARETLSVGTDVAIPKAETR